MNLKRKHLITGGTLVALMLVSASAVTFKAQSDEVKSANTKLTQTIKQYKSAEEYYYKEVKPHNVLSKEYRVNLDKFKTMENEINHNPKTKTLLRNSSIENLKTKLNKEKLETSGIEKEISNSNDVIVRVKEISTPVSPTSGVLNKGVSTKTVNELTNLASTNKVDIKTYTKDLNTQSTSRESLDLKQSTLSKGSEDSITNKDIDDLNNLLANIKNKDEHKNYEVKVQDIKVKYENHQTRLQQEKARQLQIEQEKARQAQIEQEKAQSNSNNDKQQQPQDKQPTKDLEPEQTQSSNSSQTNQSQTSIPSSGLYIKGVHTNLQSWAANPEGDQAPVFTNSGYILNMSGVPANYICVDITNSSGMGYSILGLSNGDEVFINGVRYVASTRVTVPYKNATTNMIPQGYDAYLQTCNTPKPTVAMTIIGLKLA